MQDECLLEPEIYERAEKLFRGLLHYVTELLVWEENSELSAELQPRYSLSDHMQIHSFICKALNLTMIMSSTMQDKRQCILLCTVQR